MAENPQFEAWAGSLSEGWWDDAADGGEILDSLEEAFEAGQASAVPAKTSFVLHFDAGGYMGQVTVWSTGEAELEIAEPASDTGYRKHLDLSAPPG